LSFLTLKFSIFFLIFFYAYWLLPGRGEYRKISLILASSLFYSFFSIPFLFHFYLILIINFLLYRFFKESENYTTFVVLLNLSNLILFKYFYFLAEIVGLSLGWQALTEKPQLDLLISKALGLPGFEIALPATISYYTFQLISFGFDIKSGKITQKINLLNFFVYSLFFPIMIAGPILRYNDFLSQFDSLDIENQKMFDGIFLLLSGVFKKMVLSDGLTSIIYPVFGDPSQYSGSALLFTTYFFGLHLYLDFSGLTDLARGLAMLLGFTLPINFKAPFFMTGFGDFWRRWHLTFSFWIRDYIYIPLGGSKKGEFRTTLNFIATFTLGGLWHGANLNFALWGMINGTYVALERLFEVKNIKIIPDFKFKPFLYYLFVLHMDIITWILFFTKDISTASIVITKILTFQEGIFLTNLETGIYTGILVFIFHLLEEFPEKVQISSRIKNSLVPFLSIIVYLYIISKGGSNIDFYYTKF
jgi:alginate O-acetyltransferase complex protein AlgI